MKRTQYFESVEAVNQYYPDGVPSTVIAIVGDGSNVFVSSDNAASGNQQYYSADMTNDEIVAEQVQAAEQQGYDTGYNAGETAGYEAGYAEGQAAGSGSMTEVELGHLVIGTMTSDITSNDIRYSKTDFNTWSIDIGSCWALFSADEGGYEGNWDSYEFIYKVTGNTITRIMYDDLEEVYCTIPDDGTYTGGEKCGLTIHLEAGDKVAWMINEYNNKYLFYSTYTFTDDKVFFEVETTGDYSFNISFDEYENPTCTFGLANA